MSTREKVARAIFASLKGDIHGTEWDFMKGPTNVDEKTKDRYRRMADAAISAHLEALKEQGLVVVPSNGPTVASFTCPNCESPVASIYYVSAPKHK